MIRSIQIKLKTVLAGIIILLTVITGAVAYWQFTETAQFGEEIPLTFLKTNTLIGYRELRKAGNYEGNRLPAAREYEERITADPAGLPATRTAERSDRGGSRHLKLIPIYLQAGIARLISTGNPPFAEITPGSPAPSCGIPTTFREKFGLAWPMAAYGIPTTFSAIRKRIQAGHRWVIYLQTWEFIRWTMTNKTLRCFAGAPAGIFKKTDGKQLVAAGCCRRLLCDRTGGHPATGHVCCRTQSRRFIRIGGVSLY